MFRSKHNDIKLSLYSGSGPRNAFLDPAREIARLPDRGTADMVRASFVIALGETTSMAEIHEIGGARAQPATRAADVGGVAADQLRSIVERIERLEEEKKALAEDIKEVYAEAKGNGFDTKILRKIIGLRKRDRAELDEEETILELYLRALGMLPSEE
jgi:uncharacterized protein (UPF0335 family)